MDSVDNVSFCRLCLVGGDDLVYIFEVNNSNGCAAADLMNDLLQFKVSKTDGYSSAVCHLCISKLMDFKRFKEQCLKSKVTFENVFLNLVLLDYTPQSDVYPIREIKPESINVDEDGHLQDLLQGIKPESMEIMEAVDDRSQFLQAIINQDEVDIESSISGDKSNEQFEGDGNEESDVNEAVHDCKSIDQTCRGIEGGFPQVSNRVLNPRMLEEYRLTESSSDESCLEELNSLSEVLETDILMEVRKINGNSNVLEGESPSKEVPSEEGGRREYFYHGNSNNYNSQSQRLMGTTQSEDKPLQCDMCGIKFASKHYLEQHAKMHSERRRFSCKKCGESFRFRQHLEHHNLTQRHTQHYLTQNLLIQNLLIKDLLAQQQIMPTGCKPYHYTHCGTDFNKEEEVLKDHQHVHDWERKRECTECRESFGQRKDPLKHCKVHAWKRFKCDGCGKELKTKSG